MSKTITIELYTDERDFIIDVIEYALHDKLLSKLKKARSDQDNFVRFSVDIYDLELLIGNLSLEANHNKKRSVQDNACEIAERLEVYESALKRSVAVM